MRFNVFCCCFFTTMIHDKEKGYSISSQMSDTSPNLFAHLSQLRPRSQIMPLVSETSSLNKIVP